MNPINWDYYWYTLAFCLFGFIIHLMTKLVTAMRTKDFNFKTFLKKQYAGWILAWLFCMVGSYFAVKGIKIVEGVTDLDILGILIGFTGGSLGKNVIKMLLGKEKENETTDKNYEDIGT